MAAQIVTLLFTDLAGSSALLDEQGAERIVDLAMDASGGTRMFKSSELERIYRDVRCGGFHPANSSIVHEVIGKGLLGVLGKMPRW